MQKQRSLTCERLREVLDYNPQTGEFKWRVNHRHKSKDKLAGYINALGYRSIYIDGFHYGGGRLAWLYTYGEWPDQEIDHINRNPADNRLENLRPATRAQNNANRAHTNAYRGVSWYRHAGRWQAQIRKNNKNIHLGLFNTQEAAARAYDEASKFYRGEFAVLNFPAT